MPVVLDASITLAWYLPDEHNEIADRVLDSLSKDVAFAPGVWALEVANALLVARRRSRLSIADVRSVQTSLASLPVTTEPADIARALGSVIDIASAEALSVYDAAYLELAARMAVPLATLDRGLQRAAARLGIEIIS